MSWWAGETVGQWDSGTVGRCPLSAYCLPMGYCITHQAGRGVSCLYDPHSSHAEQETIRKQFPASMTRIRPMLNRNPQTSNLKSQISNLKSQISILNSQISNLNSQTSILKFSNSPRKKPLLSRGLFPVKLSIPSAGRYGFYYPRKAMDSFHWATFSFMAATASLPWAFWRSTDFGPVPP